MCYLLLCKSKRAKVSLQLHSSQSLLKSKVFYHFCVSPHHVQWWNSVIFLFSFKVKQGAKVLVVGKWTKPFNSSSTSKGLRLCFGLCRCPRIIFWHLQINTQIPLVFLCMKTSSHLPSLPFPLWRLPVLSLAFTSKAEKKSECSSGTSSFPT